MVYERRSGRFRGSVCATLVFLAGLWASPSRAEAQPRDAGVSEAEQARRARVLARVGDETITVGAFEDLLNEAPEPIRQGYRDPARQREQLEALVTTMLLAREARQRGIDRDPQVSATVRRILSQRLEQRSILEAITPDSVPQSEVTAYYNGHLSDYQSPEYRRATVVIVGNAADAQAALTECRAARGDMRRVREVVRARSVDEATRAHEGDAFYFERSGHPSGDGAGVAAPLASAVFALSRETEVTPPVPLPEGRFGVAVLTGIRPALRRAIDDPDVVRSIRGFIVRERRTRREAALLQEVRARLNPEVHDDRLDLIHLPPSDLGNLPSFEPQAPLHPPH